MHKSDLFILLFAFSQIFGCTSTSTDKNEPYFHKAEMAFDKEFPKTWPPKTIENDLSEPQMLAIKKMLTAVKGHFVRTSVSFRTAEEFNLTILPDNASELNRVAQDLSQDGISLEYDAVYFAKNPFSAGTFDERKKVLLLSHGILKNQKSTHRVINHEMAHVRTFKNRKAQQPSPFYCKFKGKQFQPHYLSCDEMNAYNVDIRELISDQSNQAVLTSTINAARMHTKPRMSADPLGFQKGHC